VTVEPVAGTLPPEPFEFGAEKQKDQVLVSGAESATLSPDGCDLTLEWYANHRVPSVGGFSNTTTQLKLTISGDVASGQYTVSCVGECAGGSSAPASAKRMAPAG
jgi:hypothetical protein